jgi:biotin operon repressor
MFVKILEAEQGLKDVGLDVGTRQNDGRVLNDDFLETK